MSAVIEAAGANFSEPGHLTENLKISSDRVDQRLDLILELVDAVWLVLHHQLDGADAAGELAPHLRLLVLHWLLSLSRGFQLPLRPLPRPRHQFCEAG